MAAIISRRLSAKLLKPFHSSSLSMFSTYDSIFHNPQVSVFNPFSQNFNPEYSYSTFTSAHSSQSSTPSNSISKPTCDSVINSFIHLSDENPRNFLASDSPFSSQNAPQCLDLNQHQRKHLLRLFSTPRLSSINPFVTRPRFFSTNDTENPNSYPSQNPYFNQHDTERPSVELDPSSVTNEIGEVLEGMVKNMSNLNKALYVLTLFQMGFGAWIFYITRSSPITEVLIQSLLAFALPFSMVFMLRQSLKLKPMQFLKKFEEQDGVSSSQEARKWMLKLAKRLITAVAVSNVVQLGLGAWIIEITKSSPIWEVSMQSFLAFAFPISLLFVMNLSLKGKDSFYKKTMIEEHGKTLHFAKKLDLFFARGSGVSFICIAGLSAGLLLSVIKHMNEF